MFKFLKEKLGSWVEKSKKFLEERAFSPKEPEKKAEEKSREKIKGKTREEREAAKEEIIGEVKEHLEERGDELEESRESEKEREALEKTAEDKGLEEVKEDGGGSQKEAEKKEEKGKEEEGKKPGFFEKLRAAFAYNLTGGDFNEIFESLEALLLENNVAVEVVEEIRQKLEKELVGKEIKKQELEKEIKASLKKALEEIIIEPDDVIETIKNLKSGEKPFKIIFFGINGVGKTTAIAKFANLLLKNGLACVFAASDTFRAASIEQLQAHADKLGVKMIKHSYNADPSAVAFDAISYAKNHKIDVVLIDTAGRMHTKENLLKEMEKIVRVAKPDLKIFVAEAIAGNDAVEQARAFSGAAGIDGSILSKTDVDEKGGAVVSVSYATKKPILYLGTGQDYDDIELFNKQKFIERLGF